MIAIEYPLNYDYSSVSFSSTASFYAVAVFVSELFAKRWAVHFVSLREEAIHLCRMMPVVSYIAAVASGVVAAAAALSLAAAQWIHQQRRLNYLVGRRERKVPHRLS